MPYDVSTPVYEGPFDLLLHLILNEEVDLFEIRLVEVIDAFLAEVERMASEPGRLDLEIATEFLLIAATLVDLKARRLLPTPEQVDLDEELLRFEERDLLLARLLECKTFKDVAAEVERGLRRAGRSLPRAAGPEEPFRSLAPDPLESVSLAQFLEAAGRAFEPKLKPVVNTEHLAPIRVSVAEAAEDVMALLPESEPVAFGALIAGVVGKIERIVRFLACLELFKQGLVDLDQVESFGTLLVRRLGDDERPELDWTGLAEWGDGNDADGATFEEATR